MPTAHAIAKFSGYSRDAVDARAKRFGLSGDINPKRILTLVPLDANHAEALNLNEERAELARQQSRVAKFRADELEGKLADVDELLARYASLLETIAATIKGCDMPDDRKEDCFSAIRDALKEGTG